MISNLTREEKKEVFSNFLDSIKENNDPKKVELRRILINYIREELKKKHLQNMDNHTIKDLEQHIEEMIDDNINELIIQKIETDLLNTTEEFHSDRYEYENKEEIQIENIIEENLNFNKYETSQRD